MGSDYPAWGDSSCALLHHGWTVGGGKFTVHRADWVGTTDMDTLVPSFEDLIVEQCARHIDRSTAREPWPSIARRLLNWSPARRKMSRKTPCGG